MIGEADDDQALRQGRFAAWAPLLLAVLVHAVVFLWGGRIYGDLPDTIPTHWGAHGRPDAWEDTSPGTVFMVPLTSAGTTALLGLLALVVPAMTQPATAPSRWARYRQQGNHRAIVSLLGWVCLLTALFTGYLAVLGWSNPDRIPLAWPLVGYLVGLLAAIVLPFRRWERWAAGLAAQHGVHPSAADRAEDALWLPGGIRNDPDEPRILVPKREGLGSGLTVNVGHRAGKTAVAVFLGVFVLGPTLLAVGIGLAG